jgi:predicted NAD-dependent protein-ADP-ribosyltransferase YbiA (DUF1768 family)
MELFAPEVENLKKKVAAWLESPEQELEATFGIDGRVDVTTFLSVAKRLRARGYSPLPQEDRLTITLPEHLRFAIKGLGIIQNYCQDDILAGKPFVAMIKDRTVPEANIDLSDYDTRVKVRREIDLANDDAKVKEVFNTWATQKKAFRMIRRWSFEPEGHGMVIDLSIVRGTGTYANKSYKWQRLFRDQDIMASEPYYEIEVELKRLEGDTPDIAVKRLIKGIGEVLRGIQKHTFIMRKNVKDRVLRAYKDLVGSDRFRGVAPITMEFQNFAKVRDEGVPNIRDGYNVTDKADGLRVMAFCDKVGEMFMIDMGFTIYKTGLTNPNCRLSLLDGEWVTKTADSKPVSQLLLFDIYIDVDKNDVAKLPFYKAGAAIDETRHNRMKRWISTWNTDTKVAPGITAATRIQVATKSFLFAEKGDSAIFQAAARILDMKTIYNTDGLIFTPNEHGIPTSPAFKEQFKWKPSKDNTIDFLVQVEKFTDSKEDRITVGIKPETGETVTYKTLRLLVGSSADPAFNNPRESILQGTAAATAQRKGGREYRPVPFNPVEFPDTMASICYLEIKADPDTGEDYIITEDSEEPIQTKSIVEMSYDPSESPGWRWKPLRVRMDKTERLQKGILTRTLNSDKTAEGVWNSIHEPITTSMIRSGADEPTDAELSALSKETEGREGVARRYYDRKAPSQDIGKVRGLRDFHNKYIKETILFAAGLHGGGKTLLDLAVGKAADLQKWRRAKVGFVLGVDNAGNNITDPSDGAYSRYLNTRSNAKDLPPMIFAIADSSKLLADGTAGATEQEKDILRSVMGRVRPSGPVPPFVEKEGAGRLKNGADCVSVMFALHYFFENKLTFDGFLRNLADGLKVGGYFIGCCFDGDAVFNLMRATLKGGVKSGMDGNSLLWTITKQYEEDDLPDDDDGFGLGVDVEFVTIGTSHREYLVPFELLKKKLATIGCELLDAAEMAEIGLTESTSMFEATYEKTGKKFPMTASVKQFSFLNRWFVFKRKRETVVIEEVANAAAEMSGALEAPPSAVAALTGKRRPRIVGAPASLAPLSPGAAATAAAASFNRNMAAAAASGAATGVLPATGVPATGVPATGVLPAAANAAASAANANAPPAAVRTVPVAASTAAAPSTKYAIGEVFQFYSRAALQDKLKIDDKGAGRWLAPSAPFPIEDDGVQYPTLDHYMAGMTYKMATNNPNLAKVLFGRDGSIHQEYIRQRLAETSEGTKKLSEDRDFELLEQENKDVKNALRPPTMKKYKVEFDGGKWATVKDEVLRTGVKYRWENDARLRKIVEAVRNQGKILLYYTPGASTSNVGGVRRDDGSIEGENKIGRILMELAKFPGYSS